MVSGPEDTAVVAAVGSMFVVLEMMVTDLPGESRSPGIGPGGGDLATEVGITSAGVGLGIGMLTAGVALCDVR